MVRHIQGLRAIGYEILQVLGDGNSRLLGEILQSLDFIGHLARDVAWLAVCVYGVDGLSDGQMKGLRLSRENLKE